MPDLEGSTEILKGAMAVDDDGDPLFLRLLQKALGFPEIGVDVGDVVFPFGIDHRFHPGVI